MSQRLSIDELLDAGVHFGHLTRKWDPRFAPYILMEKNGIHLIDLNKTIASLEEAKAAAASIARSGRKILFVATKKQAREIVSTEAQRLGMPYVTERWLGGMLTNFATVRRSLKKLSTIDKLMKDEAFGSMAKKERLMKTREKAKLERVLGGIADLSRLPSAIFIVDTTNEHIAVAEAKKLNIPIFALVDSNSNPLDVDFAIPGNDDAYKSIGLITRNFIQAIEEGLAERKKERAEGGAPTEDESGAEEEVVMATEEVTAAPAAKKTPKAEKVEVAEAPKTEGGESTADAK